MYLNCGVYLNLTARQIFCYPWKCGSVAVDYKDCLKFDGIAVELKGEASGVILSIILHATLDFGMRYPAVG